MAGGVRGRSTDRVRPVSGFGTSRSESGAGAGTPGEVGGQPAALGIRAVAAFALSACLLAGAAPAQDPDTTDEAAIVAPARGAAPLFAATAEELRRLREALAAGVPAVVERVGRARGRAREPVVFPPRGGQHNQWYQCDDCQRALETVDDTHHRCGGCGRVFSGPPFDDVVFSKRHGENLARALDAAWAWAVAGEDACARDAERILLGYAARYEAYPYHANSRPGTKPGDSGGHLKEQTLSEAAWFTTLIAPAIDLVWPALDRDGRGRLLDHLVKPLVANVAKCRRGKSNWQSWHNAALFAGGMLLGDAALLRRSVLDPKNGFRFQMRAGVSADGMWHENSFGYHFYTLDALVHHAAIAQRTGLDLLRDPALLRMALLPVRCTLADGNLPRLGDDVDTSPRRAARALETLHAAAPDRRFLAILPAEATWDSVRFGRAPAGGGGTGPAAAPGSEVLEASGLAILRAREASALLDFAPFGGFHDHFARLAFIWHAAGAERGLDPGRAASQAYRLPVHARWYRATLAHNTVVVDGRSQKGAGGEKLGFRAEGDVVAAAARTVAAYPGVEHRRCLWLSERRLVVVDRLAGEGGHTFDWLYHDRSVAVVSDDAADAAGGALGLDGEEFVVWGREGTGDGPVSARFLDAKGAVVARLALAAGGESVVRTGTGPFRSVADRAPFVLVRRRGASAHFAAILEAGPGGGAPGAPLRIRCEEGAGGITVVVEREGGTERYSWDGAGRIAGP